MIFRLSLIILTFIPFLSFGQSENLEKMYYHADGDRYIGFDKDKNFALYILEVLVMEGKYEFAADNHLLLIVDGDTLRVEYNIDHSQDLYLKFYKLYPEIDHHIDEITKVYPEEESEDLPFNCTVIQLPEDPRGRHFIHFNCQLSLELNPCETLDISSPGLTLSLVPIDIKNYEMIRFVDHNGSTMESSSMDDSKITIEGFNQIPRERIEDLFGQKLDGDIFMFEVH
ncbi:hypothetical protein [Sanyastnella coralliicola]|uniref:hypothetical protein n=1 Tax=Sanyastnella coralliicola TaxID=3069118 RepID=UPI0027B8EF8C|nr:hypothetical protein [Longitalea sp. SCSIO 12813]